MSSRAASRLIALAGVGCISFTAVLVRLAGTSPVTTLIFRVAYALPVLAVMWLAVRHRDVRPVRSRLTAVGAGLVLSLDLMAFHISIDHIGAGLATVLASTQVVFVGILAWVKLGERPTRTALLAIPSVFAGVVLLSGLGREDAYGADPVAGVAFGLGAGLMYASFLFLLRASNRGHLAPASGPLLDATAGALLGGMLIAPITGDFDPALSWPAHGWLLALAVLGQVVGWLLITVALPRLPALDTSAIILIQPAGAILWAYLIFTEELSATQWTGVVVVLAGILVLSVRGTVEDAPVFAEQASPA